MELIAEIFGWLSRIVLWATLAASALFFLRVILTWAGANPFGRIPYHLTRITEPFVRPIRYQFGRGHMRYDLIPLVMGVMILVTGWFISNALWQMGGILYVVGKNIQTGAVASRFMIAALIELLGLLYIIAIFLRFFMPMFGVGYSNKLLRFLHVITEPLLKPLRRIFVAGMFDLSPLIAMLIVQLLTGFIVRLIAG